MKFKGIASVLKDKRFITAAIITAVSVGVIVMQKRKAAVTFELDA